MKRYNIDGSTRSETAEEKREREALSRGPSMLSREEAFDNARRSIQGVDLNTSSEVIEEKDRQETPWIRKVDRMLFGKEGEAPFKRHDPRYGDFKGF